MTKCLLFFFGLTLFISHVSAEESMDAIKARMDKRIPQLRELKKKEIIGENNKGFLEFLKGSKEAAEIVAAENADRAKVYAIIAKQNGSTPDKVAKQRAKKIASMAKSRDWLQNNLGKWFQK